jgi:hypothetical protein
MQAFMHQRTPTRKWHRIPTIISRRVQYPHTVCSEWILKAAPDRKLRESSPPGTTMIGKEELYMGVYQFLKNENPTEL